MQVEEELSHFKPQKDMLLTIGVFDGVHLGHRHLISKLVSEAKKQRLLSGVVTFKEHPRALLAPKTYLPYLTTLAERERLLKLDGVDIVIALTFDKELAGLSARDFVRLLKKYLRMKGLVIGPDFALGKNRKGDAEALRTIGAELDFTVTVVDTKTIGGERASSTAIRKALADGDMRKVAGLLGRSFSLEGKVVPGKHLGAGLGFPTANLDAGERQALPPDGVYASSAYIDGKTYQAMTNIGTNPTFGAQNKRTVESFILNYGNDIYGKDIRLEFVERLRDEKKFESPEELKKQIAEDVRRGQEILAARSQK